LTDPAFARATRRSAAARCATARPSATAATTAR
jgi:hypothetical protein